MDLVIRDWTRDDVTAVGALWLDSLTEAVLEGAALHLNAEQRLRSWLVDRVRERSLLGIVAEMDERFAGFLLGRVGEWDTSPPILRPERLGRIDVVCVLPDLRRQGIGSRLASEALARLTTRGAVRVETNYLVGDRAAAGMWTSLGFRPSLQRAYRDPVPQGP